MVNNDQSLKSISKLNKIVCWDSTLPTWFNMIYFKVKKHNKLIKLPWRECMETNHLHVEALLCCHTCSLELQAIVRLINFFTYYMEYIYMLKIKYIMVHNVYKHKGILECFFF